MTMVVLLLQPLLLILCNVPRMLDDVVIFEQYVMLIECIHANIIIVQFLLRRLRLNVIKK